MEDFEIGMKFHSYNDLIQFLDRYCARVRCKYWKRDARTILASRASGICKFLNPDIVYYEIKFSCIYGGMDFKSKGRRIRTRLPSLKSNGCSSYLRFKASDDGESLLLVAMNLNHNHELKLPEKRSFKKLVETTAKRKSKRKHLTMLKEIDNVEIEQASPENVERDNISEVASINEDNKGFCFQGLIAPVFTPFNDDLSLNLDIIPTYAQYLLDAGIEGVLVNGTTGEGPSMTVTERKLVTEAWAEACSKTAQHLMVQIGGCALPDVFELAQHAESQGASSLLCLPELYHKPATCQDLVQYLDTISRAAPNTPLLYYHIPGLTNVNIHMGKFLNEVGEQIPTFSGIKFTSTMLDEGVTAVKAYNKKFAVFLGADTIMAGAYALGFNSAIATTLNIFPHHGQNILKYIQQGQITEAIDTQDQLNNAIEAITKNGTWVPTMKEAMNMLTSIKVGAVRGPLSALSPEHVKEMENDLENWKLIK